MAFKTGNPTTYRMTQSVVNRRHQRVPDDGRAANIQRVGEDQQSRSVYKARLAEVELAHKSESFFSRVARGIRNIFGINAEKEKSTLHKFAPNAEYVSHARTISYYHKELEQGIKPDHPATDHDLMTILGQVEKVYNPKS